MNKKVFFENLESINTNIKRKLKNQKYELQVRQAIDLLTPNRFDIIAKYIYVKFKVENISSDFVKELYLNHIKVFNGFVENDESQKIGEKAFLQSFDNLIESIKNKGFLDKNIIPLANDNSILDGAHRIATAIYFNQRVRTISTELEPHNFNYEFFEKRGLERVYLDAMALEYAKLKDNVYIILIWPSAEGKESELKEIFEKYGKIVYRKNVYLTENGSVNLILQTYKNEKWLGNEKNDYIGARNKARWCFQGNNPLRVFLFESAEDLIKMKEEIRRLFNIGKHSIHINDTKDETIELAGLLFNENSIHWLNNAQRRDFKWFDRLLKHYVNFLKKKKLDFDKFCIDGGAVLAMYGIRETRDLDFLYQGKNIETGFKEISCHNEETTLHSKSKDELIFDPRNHFIVNNIKFVSLSNIKGMKRNRNEKKDLEDIKLINMLLTNGKITIPLTEKVKKLKDISYWKERIKFYLLQIRYYIRKMQLRSKK